MSQLLIVRGIEPLAQDYDGYILDLWGVIHDGHRPFPGVVDCLTRLKAAGKSICLLSNAPRRAAGLARRLDEMGVPRDGWDHVMSSGEATHEALKLRPDPFHAALGRRCLHIGPPRDTDAYEGLDYAIVADPADADFVLCTGLDSYDDTVADYAAILDSARGHGLPMICANPDIEVIVAGKRALCAGALAAYYEAGGGRVVYHGKPHRSVYDRCLALLDGVPKDRILAVGDSFRTDIAGANAMGIDGLFIAGGIHAEELGLRPGQIPTAAELEVLIDTHGHRPKAASAHFVW
ncbi:MAG: TIGR01459 family HAD-type hydrolase [Inquilinaceae bacterium]